MPEHVSFCVDLIITPFLRCCLTVNKCSLATQLVSITIDMLYLERSQKATIELVFDHRALFTITSTMVIYISSLPWNCLLLKIKGCIEVLSSEPESKFPNEANWDALGFLLSNSYTMCCPPVRGDNPRALASGLSYVQVDKHGITILYHLYQCRNCTSRDISC